MLNQKDSKESKSPQQTAREKEAREKELALQLKTEEKEERDRALALRKQEEENKRQMAAPFPYTSNSSSSSSTGSSSTLSQPMPSSSTTLSNRQQDPNNTTNENKSWDIFAEDFDDSSDDEAELDEKLEKYDIRTSYEKYDAAQPLSPFIPLLSIPIFPVFPVAEKEKKIEAIEDNHLLSFVAHAEGIKLIHSKKVNELYRQTKRKYLKGNPNTVIQQFKDHILGMIIESTGKAFDDWTHDYATNEVIAEFKSTKKEIQAKVRNSFPQIISAHITTFTDFFRIRKSTRNKDQNSLNALTVRIDSYKEECLQKLLELYPPGFMDEVTDQAFEQAQTSLLSSAENMFKRFKDWVIEQKISTRQNTDAKEDLTKFLRVNSQHDKLPMSWAYFSRCAADVQARGSLENMLCKYAQYDNKELLQLFIMDLKSLINQRNPLVTRELQNYFVIYVKKSLNIKLLAAINAENILDKFAGRTSLGMNHEFISNNPFVFYANLRVSNRSQRRRIRNRTNAKFKGDTVSRVWVFVNSTWLQEGVLETQEISDANLVRTDQVQGVGTYDDVGEMITTIKKICDVEDDKVAQWMRYIFQGDQPEITAPFVYLNEIKNKLSALVYLLLGCEATRNPAMHIINQMLLDLIIAKNKSCDWDDMPMKPKNSASFARYLDNKYKTYMPHHYQYDGDKQMKFEQNLIVREGAVIRQWIKWKHDQILEDPKLTKKEFVCRLSKTIESSFEVWLGKASDEIISSNNSSTSANPQPHQPSMVAIPSESITSIMHMSHSATSFTNSQATISASLASFSAASSTVTQPSVQDMSSNISTQATSGLQTVFATKTHLSPQTNSFTNSNSTISASLTSFFATSSTVTQPSTQDMSSSTSTLAIIGLQTVFATNTHLNSMPRSISIQSNSSSENTTMTVLLETFSNTIQNTQSTTHPSAIENHQPQLHNHSSQEGVHTKSNNEKTVLCRYFKKGYCRNGENCNFAHGPSELRGTNRYVKKA